MRSWKNRLSVMIYGFMDALMADLGGIGFMLSAETDHGLCLFMLFGTVYYFLKLYFLIDSSAKMMLKKIAFSTILGMIVFVLLILSPLYSFIYEAVFASPIAEDDFGQGLASVFVICGLLLQRIFDLILCLLIRLNKGNWLLRLFGKGEKKP